jgi:hypothetical protein
MTQFSQGSNVLNSPASNTDGFSEILISFFNLAEEAYLEKNEPFSKLKTMICKTYSFQ